MKKRIIVVLSSILFSIATVGNPIEGEAASEGKPIELKVASYLPESHYLNVTLERLFDEVQKRAGGKIRFAYYHAQSLVGAAEAFSGTVKGVCDIYNMLVPAYTPGRFPLTSLIDLAPNIPYASDASIVFWDFFNKHLKDEWKDVKVLAVCIQVPQHIHMGKTSVRDFSDLKGKQLRVYGAGKNMVQAWGGVPVSMPISEAYLALKKGVCDGILMPFTEIPALKLGEVTHHHTVIGCLASPFVVAMNWDKFHALPPDVQKVFDEMGEWASREFGQAWDRQEHEAIEFMKKEGGHEFIMLPKKKLAEWREKASSINDAWIANLEAKGIPAKKVFEEKQKLWKPYLSKEKPWAEWVGK